MHSVTVRTHCRSSRLALERAKTAKSAVDIIGALVETHGQGGTCFDPAFHSSSGYDNSFLVVDGNEAWTVETCDRVWVAKQIESRPHSLPCTRSIDRFPSSDGFYNMSNIYAIECDYQLQSKNLEQFAQEEKLWNGKGRLNFAQTFQSPSSCGRLTAGRRLLENLTKEGHFSVFDMMSILRDEPSGICMADADEAFLTTGSQVSVLTSTNAKKTLLDSCHFLTGTPNPKVSLFKPFIFVENVELGTLTVSAPSESARQRTHPLYSAHRNATRAQLEDQRLRDFEREGINEIIGKLKSTESDQADNYTTLFHDTVSAEIELLREHRPTKRFP